MVERISAYPTRIALDYTKIYGSLAMGGPYFVCLAEGDIELIRMLLGYAERRIQWFSAWESGKPFYEGVTDEQFEDIRDHIDDLGGRLMGVVCVSDIVDALGALTDQIEGNGSALASLMQCVCELTQLTRQDQGRLPDLSGYTDGEDINYDPPEESEGSPAAPSGDAEKCELAQAMFHYTYQLYTETLLPWANSTADTLVTTLVGLTTFASLASFVGIPVAILAAIVGAVIAWGVDGSIANFTNWLYGSKEEIVCILYDHYPDYHAAAAAMKTWLDSETEISFLDRALAKVILGSAWHMTWVSEEQQTNGTWDTYIESGLCNDCQGGSGCFYPGPCNLPEWSGGDVQCWFTGATVTGGLAYWVAENIEVSLGGGTLTVQWYPRTDGYETAECNIWIYDETTDEETLVIATSARAKDVLATEVTELPAECWGHYIHIGIQQDVYWAQLYKWCVTS